MARLAGNTIAGSTGSGGGGGGAGSDTTAIHVDVAGEIVGITEKVTLVADDAIVIEDSEDSDNKKSAKLSSIVATHLVSGQNRIWHSDSSGNAVGDSLFVWDPSLDRLGVGIATGLSTLHCNGTAAITGGVSPVGTLGGLHLHFSSDIGTITCTEPGTANRELIIQGTPLSLRIGGTTVVAVAAMSRVGIGPNVTDPDGTLHVRTASAGTVTAPTTADDLTVENSASGGITILTPASTASTLNFGSPLNNDEGAIIYAHGASLNTGNMSFVCAGAQRMDLNSVGTLTVVNAVHQGGAAFAVDSTTATLGHRRIYACTSTAAPRTLTIQTTNINRGSVANPWVFTVKDESGAAGTNNITIATQAAQTIDGEVDLVISVDDGAVTLYSNGSNLFVMGST